MRDHALLADGERGAVIDPHGAIRWLCVPRWHDEPVFAALIGGAGVYSVTPADPWHAWGGSYRPASPIWRSRWVTSDGIVECDEALAYPAHVERVVLLRRVRAVQGPARVAVQLAPVSGFKGRGLVDVACPDGVWEGRADDLRMRWQGATDATPETGGSLSLDLHLDEGREHDLVLELARTDLPERLPDPVDAWRGTFAQWDRTVPHLEGLRAADEVRQSYAVLAGLTSRDHGMVAAATMSLPERAGEKRDYDYRYAWIRDQCYAGQAVAALGHYPLLESALTFVTDRVLADGADLKPAYTVAGGPVPDEKHVGLPGYPGGGDIVGNWVNQQFQLDAVGEALSLYAAAASHGLLDARRWDAVRTCVDIIEAKHQEPEAGIWELEDDVWTHSRLACVAGLRSIAAHTGSSEGGRWVALADTLLSATSAVGLHPSGRWQQSPTLDRVDAALLLPPVRGALPADDPRTVATREAVFSDLTRDGHVYRFRQDGRPLAETEGSFTLCGFVMAMAHAHAGDQTEAVHYYERARACCATSGIFTEEFDVAQRQLRGNFPQAFVHAMFIEASVRVDELLRHGERGGGPAGAARAGHPDHHDTTEENYS